MEFITPEGIYPRYIGDLKLANPSWKEGEPYPEGWFEVKESPYPAHTEDEIAILESPIEIDGVMIQQWSIRPLTDEEKARRDAPKTLKAKLEKLELTENEKIVLMRGMIL